MKKVEILEHLHSQRYDIGYTTLYNQINKKLESRKEAIYHNLLGKTPIKDIL